MLNCVKKCYFRLYCRAVEFSCSRLYCIWLSCVSQRAADFLRFLHCSPDCSFCTSSAELCLETVLFVCVRPFVIQNWSWSAQNSNNCFWWLHFARLSAAFHYISSSSAQNSNKHQSLKIYPAYVFLLAADICCSLGYLVARSSYKYIGASDPKHHVWWCLIWRVTFLGLTVKDG